MAHIYKNVAAGFLHDAGHLLNDFVKENSLDFSVFSKIWRKRMFSLIFMGRSSKAELSEFTQEIFHLSTQFLTASSSIYSQVGAIYLLYALYRNQILAPGLRIRLLLKQWEVLMDVRGRIDIDEHESLHYVIDYLAKHSLNFVACPTLMGPNVPYFREKSNRDVFRLYTSEIAAVKSDSVELAESQVLENMSALFVKYTKIKKSINSVGVGTDSTNRIEEFVARLQNLVSSAPVFSEKLRGNSKIPDASIGFRRLELKAKALGQSTYVFENSDANEICSVLGNKGDSVGEMKLPVTKKGHVKTNRNIRRPKKHEERTVFTNKPKSSVKFNKRKQPRVWHYCEQKRPSCNESEVLSDCDDPNVYWFDKNLPLWIDLDNGVLSSDTEESEATDLPQFLDITDGPKLADI